jgi:hypothetical protein
LEELDVISFVEDIDSYRNNEKYFKLLEKFKLNKKVMKKILVKEFKRKWICSIGNILSVEELKEK